MRDNPVHVAVYGDDPHLRLVRHGHLVRALLRVSRLALTGVTLNGTVVAVMGEALPGDCRLTAAQRRQMVPALARLGPAAALRVLRWSGTWSRQDLGEPHVHLGPVAVDRHLQGQGLGSLLLAEHCRRLEAGQLVGYLETDKPANVNFYLRFGYQVIDQAPVLGVPTWFMRRVPSPADRRAGQTTKG